MQRKIKPSFFWWIRQIFLIMVGCFFVYFGIEVLKSSYRLNDPFSFILTFFSSNLIILISAVLVIGFLFRIKSVVEYDNAEHEDLLPPHDENQQ